MRAKREHKPRPDLRDPVPQETIDLSLPVSEYDRIRLEHQALEEKKRIYVQCSPNLSYDEKVKLHLKLFSNITVED